jgi:AcrR family transcriptional regulator
MDAPLSGRPNQRRRTRKDLLEAAARLVKQGRKPSFEEIAEEALVSRATAYRYFPNVEALLVETSLDIAIPGAEELFRNSVEADPIARVQLVDKVLHDVVLANEAALRTMLAHSLQNTTAGLQDGEVVRRQNRRLPLIEAALKPARQHFGARPFNTLSKALALIIGTEGMIVIKDVLQLDDADARRVKQWAIRALIEAAAKDAAVHPRTRQPRKPTAAPVRRTR